MSTLSSHRSQTRTLPPADTNPLLFAHTRPPVRPPPAFARAAPLPLMPFPPFFTLYHPPKPIYHLLRKPSLRARWLRPPRGPGQMGVTPPFTGPSSGLAEQRQSLPHRAGPWSTALRAHPPCSCRHPHPALPSPHGRPGSPQQKGKVVSTARGAGTAPGMEEVLTKTVCWAGGQSRAMTREAASTCPLKGQHGAAVDALGTPALSPVTWWLRSEGSDSLSFISLIF